jgi:Rps23 Pro-64 3,4-dihydroxylase Tpa1-like proline 4-hydroxylase
MLINIVGENLLKFEPMERTEIANHIYSRLEKEIGTIRDSYKHSMDTIGYFWIDDLLPSNIATSIYDAFPNQLSMKQRKDFREFKYVAAQMNQYDSILEETVYAFQDERIVSFIQGICGLSSLYPDEHLYAGGISSMSKDHFLNPHLDNSHDKDRNKWRIFNLLYYVTPNWELNFGGNLEI